MEEIIDLFVKQVEECKGELVQLLKMFVLYKMLVFFVWNFYEVQCYVVDFFKNCGFFIDMWDLYCNDFIVVGMLKGKKLVDY